MKRADDETRRLRGARRNKADRGDPFYSQSVPGAVGTAAEDAEGDAFGNQGRRAPRRNPVADGLQLARHLARQHLDKTRAEHADSGTRVGDVLQSDILGHLIDRTLRRNPVAYVAKSNRCPSTKTLATMSPPPPGIPKGELWHPAQELESGPEIRLKFLGKINGSVWSDSGAPVPLASGRPAPSWAVQFAVKSSWPCSMSFRMGSRNSSSSSKWRGTATSRPISEGCVDCAQRGAAVIPRSAAAIKRMRNEFLGCIGVSDCPRRPSAGLGPNSPTRDAGPQCP